ncbi:hypothetical protein V2J09_004413 [Rumex salicifolius]
MLFAGESLGPWPQRKPTGVPLLLAGVRLRRLVFLLRGHQFVSWWLLFKPPILFIPKFMVPDPS